MKGLPALIGEAEDVLATGEDASTVLREILGWIGLRPNPNEAAQITAAGQSPDDYVALPVVLQVNTQAPGGISTTPQGEIAFFHYLLFLPMDNLNAQRLLDAAGNLPNPADGMTTVVEGRWVLPRARIAPHVLQHLGMLPRLIIPE